jgi:hypothetical protein
MCTNEVKGEYNGDPCNRPCAEPCMALVSHSKLESSEWYCRSCHKSYPMDMAIANAIKKQEIANTPRAQAR